MSEWQIFHTPSYGYVTTVHILKSGELVDSLKQYELVEDRFSWVNKTHILTRILKLRNMTDDKKKSIIAIYEDGQLIREFVNVEHDFLPLPFC